MSHPTRVRGLKSQTRRTQLDCRVAPHTGAWIEIPSFRPRPLSYYVAPHTGAWIEITILKADGNLEWVAPHTGAWIEIYSFLDDNFSSQSHPTRVRGLK